MRKVGSKGLFFPQKKTEELLKALHEHEMQLLKKDKVLSLLDQLDAGLQSKRPPTFPVHTTLQGDHSSGLERPRKGYFLS